VAIRYTLIVSGTLIGYARCSTDTQNLTAQRDRLRELGVVGDRTYLDHGLTGTDPMGKVFFNILATFAEFEVDLLRMRTREGMAVARAKGRLRGRQPKLSAKQQAELRRMHASGDYSIADLAELFTVSRPTVYRTLQRSKHERQLWNSLPPPPWRPGSDR
jgi:DNA invertase Pin-like site-specific DNA recombinase